MKKIPTISIIIPTLNRKTVLERALLSLNKVDYSRKFLEVVVVNDGSTDGTSDLLKTVGKKLNYSFKALEGGRKGISHAKNVAIENSKGEIIISTDDDCMFEPDWLKKLIKPFVNLKVGSVGGEDRAYQKSNLFSLCADYAFSCFAGSGGIHGRQMPVKLGRFCPMGCNMAIRKKALEKTGLFDEKIAPGEETDLVYRLEKAGYKTIFAPEAFVWHRAIDNLRGFVRKIFKRGRARVVMLRRHRVFSDFVYFLPALMLIAVMSLLIASFFSSTAVLLLALWAIIYFFLIFWEGALAALRYRNFRCFFIVPFLILLQHFVHGLGFIVEGFKLL